MTRFEARWQQMQTLGEARFALRWGVLKVGIFLAVLSAIAALFDFLEAGAIPALLSLSMYLLFSAAGGALVGYAVFRWYEYSAGAVRPDRTA